MIASTPVEVWQYPTDTKSGWSGLPRKAIQDLTGKGLVEDIVTTINDGTAYIHTFRLTNLGRMYLNLQ